MDDTGIPWARHETMIGSGRQAEESVDSISCTGIRIDEPRRKAEEEAEEMPSEGMPRVEACRRSCESDEVLMCAKSSHVQGFCSMAQKMGRKARYSLDME